MMSRTRVRGKESYPRDCNCQRPGSVLFDLPSLAPIRDVAESRRIMREAIVAHKMEGLVAVDEQRSYENSVYR
jgi:hypothetical protein